MPRLKPETIEAARRMLSAGQSDRDIAVALGISRRTVAWMRAKVQREAAQAEAAAASEPGKPRERRSPLADLGLLRAIIREQVQAALDERLPCALGEAFSRLAKGLQEGP